ncbi:TIGR01777 family oxidoreductase [Candidatus Sumerlaeota bacterium]|nr:TIGR01777 family oxidoreductase [Candidatus Sumerlaeota bacterium]
MRVYENATTLDFPIETVFDWHRRPGAFERLAPPWQRVRVLEKEGDISDSDLLAFEIRQGPIPLRWIAVHEGFSEPIRFCDRQVKGPFASWKHIHQFHPDGPKRTVLADRVEYEMPLGPLGALVDRFYLRGVLHNMFEFRHRRLRDDLERHERFADWGPLRIAITGSGGLVGRNLTAFLRSGGHEVYQAVRRATEDRPFEFYWDPARGEIDRAALEGVDAVIHLAGESLVSGRWTPERKEAIRRSRTEGTRLLCQALASLRTRPATLISASAVGYYGNRDDTPLHESANAGHSFLAKVCKEWEDATRPARLAGIRVVNLRIGMVLCAAGGALRRMLVPFRAGLGGRIGNGSQSVSWIAMDDLIGAIQFLLFTDSLVGPVNAVSPHAVRNAEFAESLGRVLHRPALVPCPGGLLRLVFGEMSDEVLLSGCRAVPANLLDAGFRFLYDDLEEALRHELGRPVQGKADREALCSA